MNTLPNHSKLAIAAAVLTVLFASGCERRTPDAAGSGSAPTAAGSTSDSTAPTGSSASAPGADSNSDGKKTAGTEIDDTVATTKVKAALVADSDIKGLSINVETSNGVVTLSGAVPNQTQIDRAVKVASGVHGVSAVTNNLTIKQQ